MPPPLSRGGFGSPLKVNGFARGSPTRGAVEELATRLRGCTKDSLTVSRCGTKPLRHRCAMPPPGLRHPASASLSLASCWPRPQQLLPVSAAGARVAFAAFLRPLGRGLEKQKAAPASPPFICRWQRSAPLQSLPLPQKVRVLSAKAGENGMPFGKFAKERSNCL